MSVKAEMPADPFEAADIIAKIRVPWRAMLQNLKEQGVVFRYGELLITNRSIVSDATANPAPRKRKARRTSAPEQEPLLPATFDSNLPAEVG